jgi:phage-related protein
MMISGRSRRIPARKLVSSWGKVQAGLDPSDWKPFDDVGAGTREIRVREASGIYRVMYVAKFEEAIYVLALLPEEDPGDQQPR